MFFGETKYVFYISPLSTISSSFSKFIGPMTCFGKFYKKNLSKIENLTKNDNLTKLKIWQKKLEIWQTIENLSEKKIKFDKNVKFARRSKFVKKKGKHIIWQKCKICQKLKIYQKIQTMKIGHFLFFFPFLAS